MEIRYKLYPYPVLAYYSDVFGINMIALALFGRLLTENIGNLKFLEM